MLTVGEVAVIVSDGIHQEVLSRDLIICYSNALAPISSLLITGNYYCLSLVPPEFLSCKLLNFQGPEVRGIDKLS